MNSSPNSRKITEAQERELNALKCIRVSHECISILRSSTIDARPPHILECFRSDDELAANENNILASYLIVDENGLIYLFFSLRCGELFKQKFPESQIRIAIEGYQAIQKLQADNTLTAEEKLALNVKAKYAIQLWKNYSIVENVAEKLARPYKDDMRNEPSPEINRVLEVHPGVELKYYGKNFKANNIWNKKFPRKMGETLFWKFIVPQIENLSKIVGCEYLYLFAADTTADGDLVKYYQANLHFNCPETLGANKPKFDFDCIFLFQSLKELQKQRNAFFCNFNSRDDL